MIKAPTELDAWNAIRDYVPDYWLRTRDLCEVVNRNSGIGIGTVRRGILFARRLGLILEEIKRGKCVSDNYSVFRRRF